MADHIIFIAGPTASGKSSLALDLADHLNGEIINADAIQVYAQLNIISARPGFDDTEKYPHHLYGVIDGSVRFSAGLWARAASEKITAILDKGRTAIIVGGTGLYFRALEYGLSPIPDVCENVRLEGEARRAVLGSEAFYREVVSNDQAMERLDIADRQRLVRAWSVFRSSGKPLSYFQNLEPDPFFSNKLISHKILLIPERELLYQQCENRFDDMLERGALEEARLLLDYGFNDDLPIMRALGVAELIEHIGGNITLDEAIALAKRNTRRFAKRQMTWFRGQTADWPVFETKADVLSAISL